MRPLLPATLAYLLFILMAALAAPASAGPWLQPKGQGQLINTALYYSTDYYYDNQRQRRPQPRFTKWQLNPYAEYGLTDRVTVGVNAFLDSVMTEAPAAGMQGDNTGLSDTEFFTRFRLAQWEGGVLSAQPLIKLPSLYATGGLPRSGTEEFDAELRLMAGHGVSLWGQSHYSALEVAYRSRFGEPGDQFRADFTLGVRPDGQWLLLPQLFTTWRIDAPAAAGFTQSGQDDYDLVKAQFSAVYQLTDEWALQAGGFQHLYARNTGAGGGALVALWKRF